MYTSRKKLGASCQQDYIGYCSRAKSSKTLLPTMIVSNSNKNRSNGQCLYTCPQIERVRQSSSSQLIIQVPACSVGWLALRIADIHGWKCLNEPTPLSLLLLNIFMTSPPNSAVNIHCLNSNTTPQRAHYLIQLAKSGKRINSRKFMVNAANSTCTNLLLNLFLFSSRWLH